METERRGQTNNKYEFNDNRGVYTMTVIQVLQNLEDGSRVILTTSDMIHEQGIFRGSVSILLAKTDIDLGLEVIKIQALDRNEFHIRCKKA